MTITFELQIFRPDLGEYRAERQGDRDDLVTHARQFRLPSWRVVLVDRDKPLPLKPRARPRTFPVSPRPRWQWRQQVLETNPLEDLEVFHG